MKENQERREDEGGGRTPLTRKITMPLGSAGNE